MLCVCISDSNETECYGFEIFDTFFMLVSRQFNLIKLVSKQIKPDKVGFETN